MAAAAIPDERCAMFPANQFHSKHPVIEELEAVIPGLIMFTLPPSPFKRVPTLTELITDEEALFIEVQDETTEHKDEDDSSSSEICPACNGSGEGAYDGTSCGTCHPRRGSRNNRGHFEEE